MGPHQLSALSIQELSAVSTQHSALLHVAN